MNEQNRRWVQRILATPLGSGIVTMLAVVGVVWAWTAWGAVGVVPAGPPFSSIVTTDTNAVNIWGGTIQRAAGGPTRGFMAADLQYLTEGGGALASYSFIGGGRGNNVQSGADNSAVVCGYQNAGPGGGCCAILSGTQNLGPDAGMTNCWIGGGAQNDIIDFTGTGAGAGKGNSWIGGGYQNQLSIGFNCAIASGEANLIGDIFSTIATTNSFIAGGLANTMQASYSTIAGGTNNLINVGANNSFTVGNNLTVSAAKRVALGNGDGTYVFLDTNAFVRAGQSASNAVIGGGLQFRRASFTNLNASGTLSNLASGIIPGNCLSNPGDRAFIEWHGKLADAQANTNRFTMGLGSQTVLDTGLQTSSNGVFYAWMKIWNNGNTAQHVDAHFEWAAGGIPFVATNANVELTQTNGIDTLAFMQGASSRLGGHTNNAMEIALRPASR